MGDIDIEKLIVDKLRHYGNAIVERIREKLLENGKLATGELYNSISYQVISEGGVVTLNIYANEYFEWVDKGRKPGKQPPYQNILKWVEVRGLHPRLGSGIPARSRGLPKTDKSLAFLIARKIGLEGIKPTGILQSTMTEVQDPLATDLAGIISQTIVEIIGQDLEVIAQQVNSNIIKMIVNYS